MRTVIFAAAIAIAAAVPPAFGGMCDRDAAFTREIFFRLFAVGLPGKHSEQSDSGREPHRRQCSTGISPNRDTTGPSARCCSTCRSLPTAPPGSGEARGPAFAKTEFATDSPVEGSGFELPARGAMNLVFARGSG